MAGSRILLVDDDQSIRKVLGYMLEEAGYTVDAAPGADAGLRAAGERRPDLILSDIKMSGKDGLEFLREVRAFDPSIPVVMLTAFGTVETAVEAMKRGASDYLTKPIARDDLLLTVAKTLKLHRLETENQDLRESLHQRFRFENMIGLSPAMAEVFATLRKVAATEATVLITGESGTGKELIARAIHFNSGRRAQRMVTVNCAAIPHALLESELFGHVRGSFTGAVRDKLGKFEQADGGTLFLDEIGSTPLALQVKLLRALQEREVERVGGDGPIQVDVRILAATNRPLATLVAAGEFREDLFYRLNVVPVRVPPLRERAGDLPLLVRHFLSKFAPGGRVTVTKDALEALERYRWPGNVRELENFCERVVLMRSRDVIGAETILAQLAALEREAPAPPGPTLREVERSTIVEALRASGWNRSRAARRLGVPRHILLYRIKKFEIREEDESPSR